MSTSAYLKMTALAGMIVIGGVATASAKSQDASARFEQVDTNSDGEISLDEIKAHRDARFAKADANGDGFLTPDEMRGGDRAQKMLERFDTDGNGSLDAQELEAIGSERKTKRAARMMERVDTNGDGKVSLEEASARRDPAKMFERLDADGNGTLSAEEFAKAAGKRGHRKAD